MGVLTLHYANLEDSFSLDAWTPGRKVNDVTLRVSVLSQEKQGCQPWLGTSSVSS